MRARIYRPSKTAMQSGRANTQRWVLEFEPSEKRRLEPLMGWTSSGDTRRQVWLSFESKEEAVAFAERNGYAYGVEAPQPPAVRPKVYADNFRNDRAMPWTH
jgi:hypothetical protein